MNRVACVVPSVFIPVQNLSLSMLTVPPDSS